MLELIVLAAIAAVLAGLAVYAIYMYNRFQALRNASEATLGQIRVALRKRLDLISQLAEATKSYAKFERETLERIVEMRSAVFKASPEEVRDIDRESREILSRLIAIAESYPTLRTAEVVSKLMDSVKTVEDEIARHRYTYNNVVQEYNTRIDTFPSSLIARLCGIEKMPYLEVGGPEIEARPRIEF